MEGRMGPCDVCRRRAGVGNKGPGGTQYEYRTLSDDTPGYEAAVGAVNCMEEPMIEFTCRKCHAVVAKRQGNLLFTAGQLMSLFHSGFAFDCICGEPFYFDFRKAGQLPSKKQLVSMPMAA